MSSQTETESTKASGDMQDTMTNIQELPDAAKIALSPDSLNDFLYDVTAMFNDAFEAAPILPRPLPKGKCVLQ